MIRRLVALLFLASLAVLLPACANSEKSTENDDPSVSKIPWNRPESWEGAGPLGGMMQPQGR